MALDSIVAIGITNQRFATGVRASGVELRSNCSMDGQQNRKDIDWVDVDLERVQLHVTPFYYLFENPGRPRPNRILGGTNCRADMAPVRSAISVSAGFSDFALPLGAVVEGRVGCDLLSDGDASFSRVFARRRSSLACDCEPAEDLRRWLVSMRRERFPSIPSFVTAKKKFLGYMCLSIRCRRLF